MLLELNSASKFLVHLVRLARRNVNETQLEKFRMSLVEVLRRRYRDHWFPEKPYKGSGYRCIRINGKMDPVIAQAADCTSLSPQFLHQIFPSELTMWIDPKEVSYRIGENGSICVLYEISSKDEQQQQQQSNAVTTPLAPAHKPALCTVVAPPPAADPWKSSSSSSSSTASSLSSSFSSSSSDTHNYMKAAAVGAGPPPGVTTGPSLVLEAPRHCGKESLVTMTSAASSSSATGAAVSSMDFLLDPRKSVSIDQLAAYVSS